MKKSALVTGAAGFIGYHLCERLLKDGWRVVGLDSFTDYYDPRLKKKRVTLLKKHSGFSFHTLDIARYRPLATLVQKQKPQEIIHLAGQVGVRYSLADPWAYLSANDLGTLNVFEAARHARLPRVLYASSSSVYGAGAAGRMRESHRADRPLSVYAATKRADELLAHAYRHLYGLEMIGLRFFTVYGPWNRPDLAIFKFTKRILAGEPIDVYNRGKMTRSFTHVGDVIEGIMGALARRPKKRYEIYNLGGARAVGLMTFISLIEKAAGKKAKKRLLPMHGADMQETIADYGKARRELGYRPQMPIDRGVEEFVSWFRQNERFLCSLTEPKQ